MPAITKLYSLQQCSAQLVTNFVSNELLVAKRYQNCPVGLYSPRDSKPIGSIRRITGWSVEISYVGQEYREQMTGLYDKHEEEFIHNIREGMRVAFNSEGQIIGIRNGASPIGFQPKVGLAQALGMDLPPVAEFDTIQTFAKFMVRAVGSKDATWDSTRCIVWMGDDNFHVTNNSLPAFITLGLSEAGIRKIKENWKNPLGKLTLLLYFMAADVDDKLLSPDLSLSLLSRILKLL